MSQFLASRKRELTPRTCEVYQTHLNYLGLWLEANPIDLAELGRDEFFRYLDERHPDWSRSTSAGALAAIKSYLDWAGFDLDQHPIRKAKIKRKRSAVQRTLTSDELSKLLNSFTDSRTDIRDRALIQLAVHSGMRAAELCRLRLEDVDLDDLRFHVIQKGGHVRWGRIPDFIIPDLNAWLKLRRKIARADCQSFYTSVGGTRPGTQLSPDGLKPICRHLAKRAGIDHFSPHALRRTFATQYARAGVNLKVIAAQGGWSDISMPAYYARALTPDAMEGKFYDFAK